MMRFRSFPIGLARQWARLSVRRPDRRTSLVLMVGLVGPLAPVPVAVAAAALLPGGIAARIDLLGICILAGTTAALCAVLVMYHLLAGATVPVGTRSEIDRMISGLRDDPGGAARPLREPRPGQHKARRKAQTDPLTGLCNRLGFGAAVPVRGAGTLLYARIDGFSQMVDTHGATAMNRVLRHAAQVLERSLRPEDILARLSGETFAAWLQARPKIRPGRSVRTCATRCATASSFAARGCVFRSALPSATASRIATRC